MSPTYWIFRPSALRRRNDERNPSLVRPRALGFEHRRCRYAYGALRHFAKRISAVPRIPATTGGANEVSARWNNRLLEQGRQVLQPRRTSRMFAYTTFAVADPKECHVNWSKHDGE